jgi:hypothetical protein
VAVAVVVLVVGNGAFGLLAADTDDMLAPACCPNDVGSMMLPGSALAPAPAPAAKGGLLLLAWAWAWCEEGPCIGWLGTVNGGCGATGTFIDIGIDRAGLTPCENVGAGGAALGMVGKPIPCMPPTILGPASWGGGGWC